MSATVIDRSVLTAGLTQLGLTSNLDVLKGFESYAELLLKWNKVYNLTATRKRCLLTTFWIQQRLFQLCSVLYRELMQCLMLVVEVGCQAYR